MEHPHYSGDDQGHTTYESCEQKGKAVWWMMARLAGWNSEVSTSTTTSIDPYGADCPGNFDCDEDCDGSEAVIFRAHFGRSIFLNPCTPTIPCNGDFDCDHDCDATDAGFFKLDFGRNPHSNPCPECLPGTWWDY